MALAISHPGAAKKIGPSKLIVGMLVAAMTAFVGLAGVANAASDMPTDKWCSDHHFKNHGQCVSTWKKMHHKPGGGYGGYGSQNTTVNADVETNVDLVVNGNNNTVNVIINYIFGA